MSKRRPRIAMPTLCLLAGAVLLPHPAHAQFAQSQHSSSENSYLLTSDFACIITPPYRIADNVETFSWSPDGHRILAFAYSPQIFNPEKPQPESDLIVNRYSADTHTTTTVFKRHFDTRPALAGETAWVGKSNTAGQMVFWQEVKVSTTPDGKQNRESMMHQALMWIDAYRGTVRMLPAEQGDEILASPTSNAAVHMHRFGGSINGSTVTSILPDGTPGHVVALPSGTQIVQTEWLAEGKALGMLLFSVPSAVRGDTKTNPAPRPPQYAVFHVDSETITLVDRNKITAYRPTAPQTKGTLFTKSTSQHVTDSGIDNIIHPLWLATKDATEKQQAMLSSDSDMARMSPNGMCAAYRANGAAWAVDVVKISAAEFKSARAAARRATVLSQGKQVALAAIMWAADHDDTLPSATNLNDELTPYLKNSQLFDGLNWTYAGGPMSAIQSPAETELGTIDGGEGLAVMYADGHVKWRNR